ncbi:type II toxin-antitoxin system HipA family toxin [Leucobacter denitrificans]|uniref:Type II toxin-antitoxin system HipA family toxin n=1 Tax=Leucobacter denitrificans TaxID=683042 RepID=A0A7G9S264_9MICO|nr:type II toxin-antitoxin system HipA family toxin [Leucobacter denitrificans]QNN61939.1 type II toxin-antitoxin system HipA family toxin [Leucobacter denitrificans]
MIELDAYLDGALIGRVVQSSGGSTEFTYDDEYLANHHTPLSLSMPMERARHGNKPVRAFLAGLLPDSEGRLKAIASQHQVNWKNPVALLQYMGSDAAGAVQLLPSGAESSDAAIRQGDVTLHDDDEFAEMIAEIIRNKETWAASKRGGKWSLPGAQPKVALHKTAQGNWATPNDSTPTTHILKPSVPPYSDHHINEFMTMTAARHLGLNVARDEVIRTVAGDHVFVSQRYDRELRDGTWRRLHQEDLCQAMSVMPDQKYQTDGGPSVKQIARLLRGSVDIANRQSTLRSFFKSLVFNVAMQGTDAHAKNYSLLLNNKEVKLAPLYDLGSHAAYPSATGSPLELAMSIDGKYRIDAVGVEQLVNVAKSLDIDELEARELTDAIFSKTAEAFSTAGDEARQLPGLDDEGSRKFIDSLVDAIASYSAARGWIT